MNHIRQQDKERFWSYVNKRKDNECWEWQGGKSHRYGSFKCGKPVRAHRFSWIIANGTIPRGFLILHHCDNPPCCNPNHLFIGTQQDNMSDMVMKGRVGDRNGELAANSKLTEVEVTEMRKLHATGEYCYTELGERFGVHRTQVSNIVRGKSWKHIEIL